MHESGQPIPFSADSAEARGVYVGLGSNMGDSASMLAKAREGIAALPGVLITASSSLYETEPQGDADQPFFVNQVLCATCPENMDAVAFLTSLQHLETALGRERSPGRRFGPRLIDLDLLLFGNKRMNTKLLTLPHPRMLERAFVLAPLAEIAPDMVLPQGLTVSEALARLSYSREGNRIYQDAAGKTL